MDNRLSVGTDDSGRWRIDALRPIVRYRDCEVAWRGYIDPLVNGHEPAPPSIPPTAAIIVDAYRRYGPAFCGRFDGGFAIALIDRTDETLVLGHDDLGQAPLFYFGNGDRFRASSHLEALRDASRHAAFDEDYIADYITDCWHLGARTPHVGLSRLGPGETLVVRQGRPLIRLKSDLVSPPPPRFQKPEDYVGACREVIVRAVTSAFGTDGRAFWEVSGGLDSATTFGVARTLDQAEVTPFSYVYSTSRDNDESAFRDLVIGDQPGETIDFDRHLPFTEVFDDFQAEPSIELLNASRLKAFDRLCASSGVRSVITGVGGDTVFFANYPPDHLADFVRTGRLLSLIAEARAWRQGSGSDRSLAHTIVSAGVRPWWAWLRDRDFDDEVRIAAWFTRDYAQSTRLRRRARALQERASTVWETRWQTALRTAAHGLSLRCQRRPDGPDYRHPLMSRRLRAFMEGLPRSLKIDPRTDRFLHRHAIAGLVPEAVRLRRSKGGGPDQVFYRGLRESREWRERLVDDPEVVRRGYVDRERWRDAVAAAAAGYTESLKLFQATASLEAWLQQAKT